jgi:hypothetical protein
MQQNILQAWASQLVGQLPVLLALLLMLIVSLVLWGRYPKASLLAFLGSLLLLATALVYPLLAMYVIESRWLAASSATLGEKVVVLNLVSNLLRGVGYALLTCAIFAGRTRPVVSGFPVNAAAPPP